MTIQQEGSEAGKHDLMNSDINHICEANYLITEEKLEIGLKINYYFNFMYFGPIF